MTQDQNHTTNSSPPQQNKPPGPEKIILSTVIIFFLTLVLTSPTLENWVEVSKPNAFIRIMTPVVRGGARLAEVLGIQESLRKFRESFHAWRKNDPYLSPEVMAVDLPFHGPLTEEQSKQLPWPLGEEGVRGPFHPDNPLEILIVGDSMAGLEASLAFRDWDRAREDIRITISYKVSSSFSNTKLLDWPQKIKDLTRGRFFDAIFVWIGTNDAQSIFVEGREYPFDSPGWYQEYNRRVREFLSTAMDHCSLLYWIALPPMGPRAYAERIRTLKSHQQFLGADFPNFRFLDLDLVLGDSDGNYVRTKVIQGVQKIIRANDGIHLTYAGNTLLAGIMDQAISKDFEFTQ